ncbi:imelysin family protein [Ectopseudomonas mendocina]|uniref:Imelysin family protein n=1 Tax=Ectopseudomonas mendocina TaxID=300 RepID=A0ABZ2RF68_ECTME
MIRSTLGLSLIALSLAGCSPSDPHKAISSTLTDGVIIPAYSAWSEADRQLASNAKAFCAGEQTLTQARQTFSSAQSTWAAIQPVALGPLAEGNRAWQIQFWPDKKNLVARQVEALVKAKPDLTSADLAKASVVVQGLTAYEYLLFDPALNLDDSEQKARYCPLLTAIGEHQQVLAADILSQWQSKDGIASQLKNFPNDRYAEPQEAVTDILRTQVSAIDGLKKKLGTPLGRQSKGLPQPFQAEAWRSKSSLANLASSLASAERVWLGAENDGVQTLLSDSQHDLKERVKSAFIDTRQRLANIPRPLTDMLADEAGRTELNALYDSLNNLHRLLEGEVAKTLGIQLGFNAHDGD